MLKKTKSSGLTSKMLLSSLHVVIKALASDVAVVSLKILEDVGEFDGSFNYFKDISLKHLAIDGRFMTAVLRNQIDEHLKQH